METHLKTSLPCCSMMVLAQRREERNGKLDNYLCDEADDDEDVDDNDNEDGDDDDNEDGDDDHDASRKGERGK